MKIKPARAFTFTEVLIALAVMAALFVPMMQIFSQTLAGAGWTSQSITALNLARWQMERLKNLNYSMEQMKTMDQIYVPALDEPAIRLDGRGWRVFTEVAADSLPLKVKVSVFMDQRLNDKPLVELTTLIADTNWALQTGQ